MAGQTSQAATNQQIVQLLEEVKAQLADSQKRAQQIAKDLTRLLGRK
jgi:F0F1-type ATP synthase membrane subunit b/b'